MTDAPAIIEVGLNENQERRANRHVPYTAAELADDARRCHDAGAAVVHYHGRRGPHGEPALSDAAVNLEAQRRITAPRGPRCAVGPLLAQEGSPAWLRKERSSPANPRARRTRLDSNTSKLARGVANEVATR